MGTQGTDLEDETLAHSVEERIIAVRPRHRKSEGRGAVVEDIIGWRIRCCKDKHSLRLQASLGLWTLPCQLRDGQGQVARTADMGGSACGERMAGHDDKCKS